VTVSTVNPLCVKLYFIFTDRQTNEQTTFYITTKILYYAVFHTHEQQEEVTYVTCNFWIRTVLKTCWYKLVSVQNSYVSKPAEIKILRKTHSLIKKKSGFCIQTNTL